MMNPSILAATILSMSFAGLFFARLEVFEGYSVFIIGVLVAALLSRFNRAIEHPAYPLGILLAGLYAAYVFTFATVELDGGRDNGIYTIIANIVAEKGSVDVNSPDFDYRAGLISTTGRYPGIFPGPDGFQAQFNHISPVLRGAFIDVFDTDGLALSSALFAFAALAAFSALAVAVAGWWGLLAAAMLAINAAFVYTSRSTLSEVYTLAFVAMSFFFARATISEPRNALMAALTALSVGAVMMARVDGYLLLPLVTLTVFGLLQHRSGMRSAVILTGISAIFLAWSYFDLRDNSHFYFDATYPKGLREALAVGIICLILSAILLVFSSAFPRTLERLRPKLVEWGWLASKILIIVLFGVTVVYYIRGAIPPVVDLERVTAFIRRAPVEFTWYTSIVVLPFAFVGAYLLLKTRQIEDLALSVTSIILIVLFIVYSMISPDHPWNSRRWVPFSLPFVFLLFAYVVARIYSVWRPAAVILLAVSLPLYTIQQARLGMDWWFVRLQGGYESGFADLAAYLRDHGDEFYYATHSPRASVINFVYGIPTNSIRSAENQPLMELRDAPPICGIVIEPYVASGYSLIGPRLTTRESCVRGAVYSYTGSAEVETTSDGYVPFELLGGWSNQEEWGVWSIGNEAQISVRRPENGSLRLNVRAFIPHETFQQTVQILIDGRSVGEAIFTASTQEQVVDIDVPDDGSDDTIIHFLINDPVAPADFGNSDDTRLIGLGLISVSNVAR